MTLAAVDRLVHHATIFEMNVESYRRRLQYRRATTSMLVPRSLNLLLIVVPLPLRLSRYTPALLSEPK